MVQFVISILEFSILRVIFFVLLLFPVLSVTLLSQMMACLAKGKVVKPVNVWVPTPALYHCQYNHITHSWYWEPLEDVSSLFSFFHLVPVTAVWWFWLIGVLLGSNKFYFTSPLDAQEADSFPFIPCQCSPMPHHLPRFSIQT